MTIDSCSVVAVDVPAPVEAPVRVDAGEFTRLFAAEAPRVWRLLRRFGVREADLEDVCQEVFLVVHRRWSEFRGESSLRTWLLGIAIRSALGHRRHRGLREAESWTQASDPGVAPAQVAALEQRQLRGHLQQALDTLSEGKRQVFVLYEFEELAMPEIAQLLELPLHTCYSRLYAARTLLATKLRRLGEGEAQR